MAVRFGMQVLDHNPWLSISTNQSPLEQTNGYLASVPLLIASSVDDRKTESQHLSHPDTWAILRWPPAFPVDGRTTELTIICPRPSTARARRLFVSDMSWSKVEVELFAIIRLKPNCACPDHKPLTTCTCHPRDLITILIYELGICCVKMGTVLLEYL